MSTPRPNLRTSIGIRRRFDLRAVTTHHRHSSAVVVKDPVALKYHRMRADEYFVLQQLGEPVSLEQLRARYEKEFAPQRVSLAQLNQLLLRLHHCGLTVSDAGGQGDRLHQRKRREWRGRVLQQLSGILFLRFPGVDPEPILRRLDPLTRPLISRFNLVAAVMLVATAIFTVAVQWQRFRSELPSMEQWFRLDAILILAAVIGFMKILHELGHAIMCRHFGGECHEIGPMLLVFTPALYCDTSDSWMLRSRWQRAAVGLAGISTEVLIASLATLVWVGTAPGMIHYVALNLMLVCGLSTILFNANPLLRYDGYYVLADLCDVPNLGEQSKRLLTSTVNRMLLGIEEGRGEPESPTTRFWMLLYAMLACGYRWAITLTILWFVSIALRPHGLESVGVALCAVACLGLIVAVARQPVHLLTHPARRSRIRRSRLLTTLVLTAILLMLAAVPLPANVSAVGRIVAAQESPVYIVTPGFLQPISLRPGQTVSEGQTLATLVNREVESQYLAAVGRHETQRSVVQGMERTSLDRPDVANELPAQRARLDELEALLSVRERRRAGLSITAPRSGMLIEAPRRPRPTEDHIHAPLPGWTGYPTDPNNLGCYLESGQEYCSIISPDQWEAELLLDQTDVARIEIGASLKLIVDAAPQRLLHGIVREIARSEWTTNENADRRDFAAHESMRSPSSTSYAVRIRIETPPAFAVSGMRVTSRIATRPVSLLQRATHFLSSLLRFR